MGLRREPQPPMPIVIPSRSSAATSPSVVRLSAIRLLHEGVASLVALARKVELEGEALLEAVAALHVDGVDAVQRFLGGAYHPRALRCDRPRHLEGGVAQLVALDNLEHRAVVQELLG